MSDQSSLAAGIAETVGALLAGAANATDLQTPKDVEEIRAITEAMTRLLIGVPLRSDGQLTIKSLAAEAGLRRNKLTHKHTALKGLFYALVKAQDARPRIADDLQRSNDELRAKLNHVRAERDALRETVKRFARVIHVLECKNHQLQHQVEQAPNVTRLSRT